MYRHDHISIDIITYFVHKYTHKDVLFTHIINNQNSTYKDTYKDVVLMRTINNQDSRNMAI